MATADVADADTGAEVAVVGGGVGGLTAAHELAERGFDVCVYDANETIGGKSRTWTDDGLPAEHGFRFFPGFYRHCRDTMSRIPYGSNERGVRDNLVEAKGLLRCSEGSENVRSPPDRPRTPGDFVDAVEGMFWRESVPDDEHNLFVNRFLVLATSCEARWEFEHEKTSWWEFTRADEMSEAYRKYLVRGATKSLVAMDPERSSTRTIGKMAVQTLNDIVNPRRKVEILNGPTNDVWIDPWVNHLRDLGVAFHTDVRATGIGFDGERVTGVGFDDGGRAEADHYVLATPVEVATRLADDAVKRAAPSLRRAERLETDWMNGVQFYLSEDVRMVAGHGMYFDSPWALTSISQRQFWRDFDYPDPVEGVLSVCVSDWDTPGVVYDKPARECTPDEIADEVWTQLRRHLDDGTLRDDLLVDWHLDPAIEYDEETGECTNSSPLLVNTVGSRADRPRASTDVPNLYLASDYVRTNADLATMEGANEAGRRATNAILDAEDVDAARCDVYELEEPRVFEPFRRLDRRRYRAGKPHIGETMERFWRAPLSGISGRVRS